METLSIDISKIYDFIPVDKIRSYAKITREQIEKLHHKTGPGNDFLGWVDLPSSITEEQVKDIETTATSLREKVNILVVIGIGGSYLGAKAVIDAPTIEPPAAQYPIVILPLVI